MVRGVPPKTLGQDGIVQSEDTPRRDTQGDWYVGQPSRDVVSTSVLAWLDARAGRRVLDLGCGTGGYGAALSRSGRVVLVSDVDDRHVRAASCLGLPSVLVGANQPLPFADRSFDTVLLVEVLEHLEDPEQVIREALRVTGKRLLATVPDCSHLRRLGEFGLTFEHMLELDHRQFFTTDSLRRLLERPGWKLDLVPGDHVDTGMARLLAGRAAAKVNALGNRVGLFRPKLSSRLFADLERTTGPGKAPLVLPEWKGRG